MTDYGPIFFAGFISLRDQNVVTNKQQTLLFVGWGNNEDEMRGKWCSEALASCEGYAIYSIVITDVTNRIFDNEEAVSAILGTTDQEIWKDRRLD